MSVCNNPSNNHPFSPMKTVKAYRTHINKLPGTNYSEVRRKAWLFYSYLRGNTKRRPYVRSAYFGKDKIFLGLFWHHLNDKLNFKDKTRRLKYLPCAIDLIKHSSFAPVSKENVYKKSEILHRFTGITRNDEVFFVQIKENKNSNEKYLISVFPLSA